MSFTCLPLAKRSQRREFQGRQGKRQGKAELGSSTSSTSECCATPSVCQVLVPAVRAPPAPLSSPGRCCTSPRSVATAPSGSPKTSGRRARAAWLSQNCPGLILWSAVRPKWLWTARGRGRAREQESKRAREQEEEDDEEEEEEQDQAGDQTQEQVQGKIMMSYSLALAALPVHNSASPVTEQALSCSPNQNSSSCARPLPLTTLGPPRPRLDGP